MMYFDNIEPVNGGSKGSPVTIFSVSRNCSSLPGGTPYDPSRFIGWRNFDDLPINGLGDLIYTFNGDWNKFPEKVERRYRKQVIESDGFDVDRFSYLAGHNFVHNMGPIERLPKDDLDDVSRCAEFALAKFNVENGTDWVLSRVIKVNSKFTAGFDYFITFGAVSSSGSQEFQARVFYRPWERFMEVIIVRFRKTN